MEQINYFLFGPAFSFFHQANWMLEIVNRSVKVLQIVFDDTEVLEAIHVEGFILSKEFLEVFFAGGVASFK